MLPTIPLWTLLPFGTLVLSMAVLPWVLPHFWERPSFQAIVVIACALPIVAFLVATGQSGALLHGASSYATFIATLGALYVVAGGVLAQANLRPIPATNVVLLLVGSALASLIGTTGASVLMIRPLLRINQARVHTRHLVPFFILAVSNAGGMLTPLGDPPLLMGFVDGVPFLWTLQLWPVWLLYNLLFATLLYLADRRASRREEPAVLQSLARPGPVVTVRGKRNLPFFLAIPLATFLPSPWREVALVVVMVSSYFVTPRDLHRENGFSLAPALEVGLVFAGLFICLVPVELTLSHAAHQLPIRSSYQLFWASGLLSAALDNAPTYAAFAALARSLSEGQPGLVAGIAPLKLMAISVGCVVMGATTYIGNGPNLLVKAIAERAGIAMPSFMRYALFALLAMLPAHAVVTITLLALER